MSGWLPWKDTAVRVAVLSAVASAVVSVGSAGLSFYSSWSVQQQQINVELAGKFVAENGQLTAAGGEFIGAVNAGKNLQEARTKFNGLVDQKISAIPLLQNRFGLNTADAQFFKTSLVDLVRATNEVRSPNEMPQWAEAFGRIIDTDQTLSQRFYKKM